MNYGICLLSIVPCRAEPSHKSEMVSQLLFGDLVKVLSSKDEWLKIEILSDKYLCWVDRNQITLLTAKDFKSITQAKCSISEDVLAPVKKINSNELFPIPLGSRIYGYQTKNSTFSIGIEKFEIHGSVRSISKKVNRKNIVQDALLYLNSPYLWGGKTPMGIDCSGFVQMVYRLNGVELPRDAYQQAEIGQALSFIEEAEEGDLAFFDNEAGKIIHVGIILKNHRIIHSSGRVRIDGMDHQGIYRNDQKVYSHKLRIIKKII